MRRTEHNLLCSYCADPPIMGKYGRDEGGNPYVHVKAWKQGKLIVEVVQTEGVLSLRCRKCLRWQRITIRGRVQIKIEHLDAMLALFRE